MILRNNIVNFQRVERLTEEDELAILILLEAIDNAEKNN